MSARILSYTVGSVSNLDTADELWLKVRNGNVEDFSRLHALLYGGLYNYGHHFTTDSILLEDAIQELFIRLWQTRQTGDELQNIKAYLFCALRRALLREKGKFTNLQKLHTAWSALVFTQDNLPTDTIFQERQVLLIRVLNALPLRQKEIIYLRFYDGLTYEEIAQVLAMNYQSVRNSVFRAMKSLRAALRPAQALL